MNTKIFLAVMLLVFGAISFAAPNVTWASPTPDNATDYYGDATVFNMSSNESMGPNTFINIDGTNYTCTLSANNLSCSYALNITEKVYGNTYDLIGYANITTYVSPVGAMTFDYHGCGQISGDQTLEYDIGSINYNDDCFQISADNTSIDCVGYTITMDNETDNDTIYGSTLNNITVKNCIFESGYNAINWEGVDNSTISNNTFNNQTWNAIQFDVSNLNSIQYNRMLMDFNSHINIYGFDCINNCNGNNFSYNNMSGGGIGIQNEGNDTIIWRNNIFNMDATCVDLEGSGGVGDGNLVSDNEIYGCALFGIIGEDMNSTTFMLNHLYNNSADLSFYNNQNVNLTNSILGETLDRPAGDSVNFSAIALVDVMLPNSGYSLVWHAVNQTPSGRESFLGKYIEVSALPVNTGYNLTLIDLFGMGWTVGEATGYDESKIEMWAENVNGTLVLLNNTPNPILHSLVLTDFRMEDYTYVGLFYHGESVPNVPGNVDDEEAMLIVSQFTSIAIAFFVLFTIVGAFGLQKFYDFKDMFVPLMVVCLLAILAMGLFM